MSYVFARITESDFRRWLRDDEYAAWETWAISRLWDYVSEMAETADDCYDDPSQLLEYLDALTDPVAIRCDWSQYDDIEQWYDELGRHGSCPAPKDYDDMDDWRDDAFAYLTENKVILWDGDPAGGFVLNCSS